eukprot:GHVQ01029521.1.p1 GENE.GHVQ01029521.1~~GHVQ01029521.1.p1  ORF type:complete len:283 (+),score=22.04 GHVQ01029521.1:26-850(+)
MNHLLDMRVAIWKIAEIVCPENDGLFNELSRKEIYEIMRDSQLKAILDDKTFKDCKAVISEKLELQACPDKCLASMTLMTEAFEHVWKLMRIMATPDNIPIALQEHVQKAIDFFRSEDFMKSLSTFTPDTVDALLKGIQENADEIASNLERTIATGTKKADTPEKQIFDDSVRKARNSAEVMLARLTTPNTHFLDDLEGDGRKVLDDLMKELPDSQRIRISFEPRVAAAKKKYLDFLETIRVPLMNDKVRCASGNEPLTHAAIVVCGIRPAYRA